MAAEDGSDLNIINTDESIPIFNGVNTNQKEKLGDDTSAIYFKLPTKKIDRPISNDGKKGKGKAEDPSGGGGEGAGEGTFAVPLPYTPAPQPAKKSSKTNEKSLDSGKTDLNRRETDDIVSADTTDDTDTNKSDDADTDSTDTVTVGDGNGNAGAGIKSKIKTPALPFSYQEPEWSSLPPDDAYSFEVLKNGKIIDTFPLKDKPYIVFGRLPSCDFTLEHPSLSRYHAIIQYSKQLPNHEQGWYIYDLDSTHGTWINKRKVFPNKYYRIKVGYVIKFGGSSRLHILQGPLEDQEEESELSVTEMREQREKQKREAEVLKQMEVDAERARVEAQQKILEDRGCGWGMGEDAVDDEDEEKPFTSLLPENESMYIDDPKKCLKNFYEREGCDLPDYQFTEVANGKHKCVLELPVDGPNGEDLIAEAVVSGKRKDAVIACALEACRILDKCNLLRQSKHVSRKRKNKNWEEDDFYDSDEDTFLDRTGTIEKKRFQRMKKAGKDEVETYDSLLEKYNKVAKQIHDNEEQLAKAKAEAEANAAEDIDELDAYMNSIKSGAMDTKTRMRLKSELLKLKAEETRLRGLVNIAKPATMPPLKPPDSMTTPSTTADLLSRAQNKLQKKVAPMKPALKTAASFDLKPDNFEEEDEDEELIQNKKSSDSSSSKKRKPKPSLSKSKEIPAETTIPSEDVRETKPTSTSHTLHPKEVPRKKKDRTSTVFSTASVLKAEKTAAKLQSTDDDPDYSSWLPPEEQCGDGRTSLNDKLGY